MNMMNTMRRGLATTAMSLVCLMAGTMNTLAATDAGTELVSQIDAAAGEETNGTSTEAAQTPSGPASDPELIRKQTNAAAEEAADTNASEAEVAAFSNESAQVEAENADEAAMTENTDTNAAAEAQEAEAPAEIYAGRFTTTAYCSCRRCCRGGKNRTKSGTIPQAGHTISADLRVFPLGTKLRINGVVLYRRRQRQRHPRKQAGHLLQFPQSGTAVWKEKRRCLYCPIITLILSKKGSCR